MSVNVSGAILKRILSNPDLGLEVWSRLKLSYFNSSYTTIYSEIFKFYTKYNKLPTFEELLVTIRNVSNKTLIKSLEELEVDETIDLNILLEVLINEYTQSETLTKLDGFLDNITLLDSEEIKDELSQLVLFLEEKTHNSAQVILMSDMLLFDKDEIGNRVALGLNNTWDAATGGIPPTEFILIGGYRGSGKSVICANIVNNQYQQGNIGLYFSIEMRGREIFSRCISALAGVDNQRLRKGLSNEVELDKVAKVRSDMFLDSSDIYKEYLIHKDYNKFEQQLIRSKQLKPDNQIIIIDDQRLTIPDIDLYIQKFKAQFKEKLKVAVVDYVNAIEIEDAYNWQSQVTLSNQLKSLARKYDLVMVAPYQIDQKGEARFAKGILDKADTAMILKAESEYINFTSVKSRNIPPFEFNSPINWSSLQLSPLDAMIEDSNKPTEYSRSAEDAVF